MIYFKTSCFLFPIGLPDGHIHKFLAAVRGANAEGWLEALLSADADKLGGLVPADETHCCARR